MKRWIILILVLCAKLSFSQKNQVGFDAVDQKAEATEAAAVDTLAKRLTAFCSTETEKARAIFRWITEHIAYKTKGNFNASFKAEDDDTSVVLKPLNERIAESVIKKKTAVCDGYARLFKTLCDKAGIRSEIITGYARGD